MAGRDNPNFLSADTLKGDKVVNEAGDDLGKIEEFMIDLDNGRVAYTVLSLVDSWAWATSYSLFPGRLFH